MTTKQQAGEKVEELLSEAKTANASEGSGKKPRRKGSTSQDATKDVVVQGATGPVTVLDKSVNVVGDGNSMGAASPGVEDRAGEILGKILEIAADVYARHGKDLSLRDAGPAVYEHFKAALDMCDDVEEVDPVLKIVRMRIARKIEAEEQG